MSLLFSLLMKADAGQAKAELRALQGEVAKGKTEVTGLGNAAVATDGKLDGLAVGAGRAAAANEKLAQTQTRLQTTAGTASGSVGNLVAQFNDIGMMMAAGQSPLQLAIQQGSQITQVIGPMGAAGAARALGGAFIGMLNPVSLITMGAIAAGAAFVQWLTAAEEDVKSVEDALSDLDSAVDRFASTADKLSKSPEEAAKSYGRMADEAQRALAAAAKADERAALAALRDGIEATTGTLLQAASARDALLAGNRGGRYVLADDFNIAASAATSLLLALENLTEAKGPDEQAAAALRVVNALDSARDSAGQLPGPLEDAYSQMAGLVEKAAELVGTSEAARRATIDWKDVISDAAAAMASVVESAPGGGWLSGAIGDAGTLASTLWDAARAAAAARGGSIVSANPSKGPTFEGGGRSGSTLAPYTPPALTLDDIIKRDAKRTAGAGGAKAETDAVAELILKLREEQEVLQEADPVKRQMLKYRQQLAEATVAEKAEVEGLIRAETQLKAVQAAREYATDAVGDFLDQIIAKGGKASDVLKNLAAQFLSMAARSVLSGSGWFANMLGISGPLFGGGLQAKAEGGMIYGEGGPQDDKVLMWGSAGEFMMNGRATRKYRPLLERLNAGLDVPGLAAGGPVGGFAGRATGGESASGQPVIHQHFHGAAGNDEVRRITAEGVRAGLKHFNDHVLPGRVAKISRSPRDR